MDDAELVRALQAWRRAEDQAEESAAEEALALGLRRRGGPAEGLMAALRAWGGTPPAGGMVAFSPTA